MIIETAVIGGVASALCVLSQRSLYTKKIDYLRDVISNKETNIAILKDSLDKVRVDSIGYKDDYSKAMGQVIAMREVLEGTKENK